MKTQKGITLIALLIIIILIVMGFIFLISKGGQPNASGQSTTDYNYLLNNKPSATQIANAQAIDYRSLYKGAKTLNGNYYSITGEVVQQVEDHIFHVNMTKSGSEYYTYYTDRIQISVIGTTSEILMEGDIISFVGEALGNYTYTNVLGSSTTVPFLRVYAENLKVVGHTDD